MKKLTIGQVKRAEEKADKYQQTALSLRRKLQIACEHKWKAFTSTGTGTEYQCKTCGDWK